MKKGYRSHRFLYLCPRLMNNAVMMYQAIL